MLIYIGSNVKTSVTPKRARGHGKHLWSARTHPAPRLRVPSTAFDRACRLLCALTAIDLETSALLQGRARPETIRDWRRGRRRTPIWAIEVLQEFLRSRGRDMLEIADQLENERQKRITGRYLAAPPSGQSPFLTKPLQLDDGTIIFVKRRRPRVRRQGVASQAPQALAEPV